jgi:hypothetical protein
MLTGADGDGSRATGCVDWLLPLDKIGAAIKNLVLHGKLEGILG